MKTRTKKSVIERDDANEARNLWLCLGLLCRLKTIIDDPTPAGVAEFQQLVQYAPHEMREKLLKTLRSS